MECGVWWSWQLWRWMVLNPITTHQRLLFYFQPHVVPHVRTHDLFKTLTDGGLLCL